jgi:hypothetical protein
MEGDPVPLGGTLKARIQTHVEFAPLADYALFGVIMHAKDQ